MPLCDFVSPLESIGNGGTGSTDMGDVNWVVSKVQARIATCAIGALFHKWQTVSQGKAPAVHKGMVHAAKIMASTAGALIKDPRKLKEAKDTYDAQVSKTPYICPIPEAISPPVINNKV